LLFIPQMIQSREWLGLLVLLFPLIGVLLLVGAINGTIHYLKRGGVSMMLADESPRAGGIVQGHVAFGRGVTTGDMFKIKLVCIETRGSGEDATSSPVWTKEIDSRANDVGGEKRLQFRFDVPSSCKPSDATSSPGYRWRVEARPAGDKVDMPYGFQITLDEPLMKDDHAAGLVEEPVKDAPELPEVEKMLAGAGMDMDERKRRAFNQMTPEQRAMAIKAAKYAPIVKKAFIGIVLVFVAAQVIGPMSRMPAASYVTLAVPFLVVGAAMTWVAASTIHNVYRASDWVKVRAEVVWSELAKSSRPRGSYLYEHGGQSYESDRLGFGNVGMGIVDEWPAEMHYYLSLARAEKRPIMVWMNPDKPAEAVVDRELRAGTVLLVLPFALLLDGAAVLALRAAWRSWRGLPATTGGVKVSWNLALFWNIAPFALGGVHVFNFFESNSLGFALIMELFILIGFWLLWRAIRTTYESWDQSIEKGRRK
jgi:hypothetical protein